MVFAQIAKISPLELQFHLQPGETWLHLVGASDLTLMKVLSGVTSLIGHMQMMLCHIS